MKGHYFSALPLLLRFAAWAAWLNCITAASLGEYERFICKAKLQASKNLYRFGSLTVLPIGEKSGIGIRNKYHKVRI